MLLRRIARPLLATAFMVDGTTMFIHPEPLADSPIATRSPTDPTRLVRIVAAIRVGGGLALAFGRAPRIAALALTATTVPVLAAEGDFRSETDPDRRSARATAFVKDIGLLGGLLLAVADTEGKPSLGWRGRRVARETAETISAALPSKNTPAAEHLARHTRDALEQHGHDVLDTARNLAEYAREETRDIANAARPILEAAARDGIELAGTTAGHGERLIEAARGRGAELAETARDRLAETARGRGAELAETARDRLAETAETARDRGAELAETARDRIRG